MAAPPSITDKQKAWARAYVGPSRFNASAAARLVGIKEGTGRDYRANSGVMDYVEHLQQDALRRHMLSQARTLEELIAMGFSNITDIITVEEGKVVMKDLEGCPRFVTAAIKKMKLRRSNRGDGDFDDILEIELHDKMSALRMLGQHQGLFEKGASGDEEEHVFTGLEIVAPTEGPKDET